MFGKKPTTKNEPASDIAVQTIPADFYAGANPVIKFKNVEKEVLVGQNKPSGITVAEKKVLDKTTAVGAGQPLHPANVLSNRKFFIIAGVVLLLLFTAGASWYYYRQAMEEAQGLSQSQLPASPAVSSVPATVTTTLATTTEVLPEEQIATTTPVLPIVKPAIEFPSILLGDSADLDNDKITDAAEEIFGTDPGNPDSDGDKYADGLEIYYLYNPAGAEPMKLIDAATVVNFTNPVFGYQIYYPKTWIVGNVDETYRDILFSTLTGENIEIQAFDLDAGSNFAEWFALYATGETWSSLQLFESRFQEKGLQRSDGLVYYFTDNRRVYVLIYHPADANTVNYRSIISVMARSFRLTGNTVVVPLQAVVTEGATPTTSGESAL